MLTVPDFRQAETCYVEALGLRVTDRMDMGGGKGATFLRASARHHSLAVTDILPEPGFHHFMIEVKDLDDVGLALDRAVKAGVRIAQTIGRHANDRMISFYALTPSGFQFEFGWGGRIVDDATWEPTEYDHISEWGHMPPQLLSPRQTNKKKTKEPRDGI